MYPTFKKVVRHPVGSLRRTIDKFIIGPRRYRNGEGYDAKAFWGDRFSRYGDSSRGPGDEGLSEASNDSDYLAAGAAFRAFCDKHQIDFAPAATLEIGPGNGFYTEIMAGLGAKALTCVDITDVMFDNLRTRFPFIDLRQGDVTERAIEGSFDIAIVIDVIEHIVSENDLRAALRNVAGAVSDGGTIVLGPVLQRRGRHLFYVHFWTESDVRAALSEWTVVDDVPFRSGQLLLLRRDL